MKPRKGLLVTLALATGLVAVVAALRTQYPRLAAWSWHKRLQTVPDQGAPVLLEGVARLGEPGIPVLVEALGSDRQAVATSGKRMLAEEMRRWEALRAEDYSPKLAILARALADRVERFGPGARGEAAGLASQILRFWTLDPAVVDRTSVIADCEKVLRSAGSPGPLLAQREIAGQPEARGLSEGALPEGPSGAEWPTRSPLEAAPGTRQPLPGVASVPGGRLPIEMLDANRLGAGVAGGGQRAESDPGEPRRLRAIGTTRPLQQPPGVFSGPDGPAAVSQRPASPDGQGQPADPAPVRPMGFLGLAPLPARDRGQADAASGRSAPLETLDTVELVRRLRAPEQPIATEAEAELARRGFARAQLALARQLFDPDPRVRLRLVQGLVQLPDVDAVPWLLELSRDEDPEVRLAALAMMATTGDPALLEMIEAIARNDPDPRVQHQAERIAAGRRAAVR